MCISFSWIFPLLFPAFYADIQFLFVAAVFGPFLIRYLKLHNRIALKRKTSFYILISTASSILGILFALYLIPLYGAKGAALSVMTSYMCFRFQNIYFYELFIKDKWKCFFSFINIHVHHYYSLSFFWRTPSILFFHINFCLYLPFFMVELR